VRSSALATALIGGSILVGTGLFEPSAAAAALCASPPLSGTTTATGVINTYYPAQTSIVAGTSSTTTTLGTSRGSATQLAVGDLVLVMQMQGAQIDSTNTDAYGDGVVSATASGYLNNASFIAGHYEYATVRSVAGAVVGLNGSGTNGGLVNSYVNASESATQGQQRFQVVRVPQYSSAILSAATPPAAVAWDGSSGGIVVIDVASNLNLNSATIDTSGQGFQPGLQRRRSGATGLANTDYRTPTAKTANGQKAEGIAGTAKWTTGALDTVGDGYPNGDFGDGAPGNAGGGGTDGNPAANDENSGGGGGGNGGAGGVGGNTWSSNLARGGYGGASVTASASRVVLGGGGGAGSDNNALGSSAGGAGGGIVLVRSGSLTGTGTITSDGAVGQASGQDGSGGGGAGGSVVVLTTLTGAASGINGLTINARGGAGGNETHADKHGPGGGGGGGEVITSAAAAATSVTGGVNGTHVASNTAYGATSGSVGATSASAVIGDPVGTNTGSQCIDVSVTKSVGSSPVIPGQTVTYTLVATNNGPYPRSGTAPITVTDTLPAGLTSATWTCVASAGSSCTASGSGSLNTTANLEVGDTATYTITATLSPIFTGTLSNTATAAGPAAIPELDASNNTATSAVLAEPRVNLSVTKTDGSASAVPGTNVTYTIVAANAGPSTATSAAITDPLPSGASSGTWSCVANSGGTCAAASGAMPMSTTATLASAGSVTYTVIVAVSSTATGSLANSVTISAPAGVVETNSANNVATDTDTLTPTADVSISKTDGLGSINAGTALTYTVVASNAGPSAITSATVTDTMPASLTGVTWTCAASAGSSCPASGSGSIAASVNILSGGSVTFSVNATVSSTATGTLSNTATVALPGGSTDPTPANNSATDTTTINRQADVSITKTDGSATAIPGSTVTYTIVASNAGPSAALATAIADTLPATLSGATWTCSASAGSTCPASGSGNIATTADLLPSGTATFTVTATIASTATGTLANTATATVAAGITDPTAANNSATDTDTLVPTADLSITKTDGSAGEVPGTSVSYTIVAASAGPSMVTGATVSDTLPATLSAVTWTCAASAGSTCPASGSGNISASVNLAPGGTATFTVNATISTTATGSLTNTATIAAPASVTDPTPGNNSASDSDTLTPTGDLSITKTDGSAAAIPGQSIIYTIVASNAGPSAITSATVTDTVPAALTGVSWTCSAIAGSSCPASGSGSINATISLGVTGTVTFTVNATISSTATGSLINSVTITAPVGSSDPTGANNTATDTDSLTPRADLSITKTDGLTTQVPGNTASYTVVASNAGPSSAPASNVTDTVPASLSGVTWTCAAGGGATCPASGSGSINAAVDLPVDGSATFIITGTVAVGATGTLANTATASVGAGITDPVPGNNTATDSDTLTPTADLVITKTDASTTEVPGTSVVYTVVASNAGPSTITGATVTDTMAASLSGVTWSCAASAGSTCPASGSGSISASVTLLPSGTATFTITGTISSSASGTLVNTASVALPGGSTDPTPANNTATDTDSLTPTADLSITKNDGVASKVPGTAATYAIVATNSGPSSVIAATVTDTVPAILSGATWTCSATGGASCPASGSGNISASVDLPVGGAATFTMTGTVSASATGNLVNTATITAPGTVTDPTPVNNSATDTDALAPTADLSITKTDGVASKVPGTSVTYTIVATNLGPSSVSAATVTDSMPAALSAVTWTCAGTGGGTCPVGGSGNINSSVGLPVGASVTFTVAGSIPSSATGTLVNTATVAPPAGATDPTPANNSATDTDTLTPTADLSITKTDGSATQVPGTAVTYTVVATNTGPSSVIAAPVIDTIPATLSGSTWTCVPTAGGSCAASSGNGSVNTTVDLPVGAGATFSITATVAAAATGSLVNTASIAAPVGVTDPTPANNSSSDTDTLNPTADLSITKTDGVASIIPGQSTTYTVVVGNSGPSTAVNAPVADALPFGASSGTWTCVASAGAGCAAASGAMPLATTTTQIPGSTVTYTVVIAVSSAATGSLVNTATVSAPAGVTDPTSANNSATDTDTLTPTADVSISKTDGLSTVVPGSVVTYTVVASNPGPSTVTGATVTDSVPGSLAGVAWTCAATAGSGCPASGTGNVSASITLAPAGSATFSISGTVVASATGTISNTATISLPGSVTDPTPGNNSATDVTTVTPQTDLRITKTDGAASAVPGQSTTYTVVVTNVGPSTVTSASVTDVLPTGATSMNWTCAGAGGGTCALSGSGSIDDSVNLPVGASATYSVSVPIAASATGSLTNAAAVTAPLGVTDTNSSNNSATDTDTLTPLADLTVTKTDGVASVVPGQSTTYTITVANSGPSNAPVTVVTDAQPVGATFASWSCAPSAGASCTTASGSGSINTTVGLPVGTTATFTVVTAIGPATTGTLANTATAAPAVGITDPVAGDNSATDSDTLTPSADLAVSKTNVVSSVVPGTPVSYTIVASNTGPSAVTSATVADALPASLAAATWTCTTAGGGSCTASGSGSMNDIVNLPVGATATYTVSGTVAAGATGAISNTATIAAPAGVTDPVAANNAATDSDPLTPRVDLSITKTDGRALANPLDALTYTIVVSNAGPSSVSNAVVADTIPPAILGAAWTCTAGVGGNCDTPGPVSGDINSTVDLGVNGSVTFTVTGTIAGYTVGSLVNTATVSAPAGVTETNSADNAATDSTAVTSSAALWISKTDGQTSAVAGTSSTYTITVVNSGPSAVVDAGVLDSLPAAFTSATWTCFAAGGGHCDNAGPTAGNFNTTVDLPAGGSATFTVTGTLDPTFTGVLTNTATVAAPPGTIDDSADNSATDVTTVVAEANLIVTKSDSTSTATPGANTTYTVTVRNAGPSTVAGATVADVVPAGAIAMDWTCTASAGSSCGASGSGALSDTVNLAPAGVLTYVVTVQIGADATSTISNTATATVPASVTETSPSDNSATDVDTLIPDTDLAITKTDNATSAVPGTAITYTVVATNNGPSASVGTVVADVFPATLGGATWTCVGPCTSSGSGALNDVVDLPVGGSVTYTVNAVIASSATGTLNNTATAAAASGTTDSNPVNNTATDVDTLDPHSDLSITKTDGSASEVPGTPVTYTIAVSNNGPSNVVGASVVDAFATNLTNPTWSCTAIGGTCPPLGTGNINTFVDLAAGGAATFTVIADVVASATGTLSNTATVSAPPVTTDPNAGNNSSTDVDTLGHQVDLSVTKTDNRLFAQPGDTVVYSIVVSNAGPSAAADAPFVDIAPASLSAVSWTCLATAGSTCAASGSGNAINTTVSLTPGGTATFAVAATVVASASGVITNTATIAAPIGETETSSADNTSTDTTSVTPTADLIITKTDGRTSAVPGTPTSYTIIVTNGGPSEALGVAVNDTLPATLTGGAWSCSATPGSTCANPAGVGGLAELVDVAAGGTVTFVVTATIAADATGVLSNTATLVAPAGFNDTNSADDSATDVTDLQPTVDLAVAKTDGQTVAVPGTAISYTISVTNSGPSMSVGSRVVDNVPAGLTAATWTCVASFGSACGGSSGTGPVDELVTVGVGGTVTYIVSATVSPSAAGVLSNSATVMPAAGTTDTDPGNNSATDVDSLTPQANLSIVKTDGVASAVPGTPITYSIIVNNAGPSAATGASIADALPGALTNANWTCTGVAGGACGSASGTGAIATTADLPSGAQVTYNLAATIAASASGSLTNAATVEVPAGVVDPYPTDNVSTDTDNLTPLVDLSISKDDGIATAVPGTSTTYTIAVGNSGPSAAIGALITDLLPPEVVAASWGCTSTGGATCGTPGGSGNVSLVASIPAGASVSINLVADVDPSASGFVVNTAAVTAPAGVIDTNASNDVATDPDVLTPVADLSITKDDGLASALPGDAVSYLIVATNNGPSAVSGAAVTDVMPSGLTGVTWTCAAGAGSACSTPSGTGDINASVDLAPGASATITVNAMIAANQLGTVTNTVSIDAPAGVNDPNSANDVATDATGVNGLGDVSITKTDGLTSVVAGTSTTYSIVASNPGPSDIAGIQVVDALPSALVNARWTCTAAGTADCNATSGSGSINSVVDLPAATAVTFTVRADVTANASGILSNTAGVVMPNGVVDSDATNNSSTDNTAITAVADLTVTKTDNAAIAIPGNAVGYDITVVNNGPSAVAGASITDRLPATIAGTTWTCVPSAGAACGAPSGSGDVVMSANLAVGASVVVHLDGTVAPRATGSLSNTAIVAPPVGVTDPNPGNNASTDSDSLDPIADVSVTKSNGVASQSPGATSAYVITVANAGPSAARGVTIDDPLPTGVTLASWTCSAAAGSSCAAPTGNGAINTTVDLAAAGTATFIVTMQAGTSTGTLTNTVAATVAVGTTDPNPANNVASDIDTLVFSADISVTKTASAPVVAAGQAVTYSVVVNDIGPDPANGVTVLDTVPAGLTGTTWTCAATPGSSCPASGSGNIATTADLLAGGSATFTVTAVTTTASPATIVNTATVAIGPGTIDPDPTNNTASATVTVDFAGALSVQKTASVATAKPGDTFSYEIVVSNAGPARLDGVGISDPVSAALVAQSWTCVGSNGGMCNIASGSGSPMLTADLPVGATVTITLIVSVAPNASGQIANVVTISGQVASQPVTAQAEADIDVGQTAATTPALTLTKSSTATTFSAVGAIVPFTLVATNTGNATLTNVTITDANATITDCAPVTLAPGQSLTCAATHLVTQTDLDHGGISNTASASGVPPTGPAVFANSQTVLVPAARVTDLKLEKSSTITAFKNVGDTVSYTIVATNMGNVTLMNVAISDPNAVLTGCAPTNLAPGQSMTCAATHVVTTADISAKVIVNQAHATALPTISLELICPLLTANGGQCPSVSAVSAASNTVVLKRAALLPRTGGTVVDKVVTGGALSILGALLMIPGRRRRRSHKR
jgi:uncharacterized repeat protein (TIGR01451 family)